MKVYKSLLLILSMIVITSMGINDPQNVDASEKDSSPSGVAFLKGSVAPDFTIESMMKEKVSLKDYRGSILVLAFGFNMDSAKDIEKYRDRIRADYKSKGVNFLKVIHINIPSFGKGFVLKRMKKLFPGEETTKHTVIDWGGAAKLDKKYGIKEKEPPTLFIIGKEGKLLYCLQGLFDDENLVKIENEISEILKIGENHYLGIADENMSKKYLIGVTRIMQHKDLITKQNGFKAAIEAAGFIEGKNIRYDVQDTLADVDKIAQVSNKFVKDKAALIHCLSITGTMILLETVKDLPVVGYAVYAGDPTTMGYEAANVTGIMVKSCPLQNLWPVKSQLEMYLKFMPGKKKWGTVYNSGSANTRFHMEELRDVGDDLGVEIVEASVSKPSEVISAAQSLVGKVDAIYITSDEMSMSKFDGIVELCNKNKIPLFGGEFECVKKGAIAAYDVNYFKIGYIVGKQAVRILKGENPKAINPEFYTKLDLHISLDNAKKQGINISDELKSMADKKL